MLIFPCGWAKQVNKYFVRNKAVKTGYKTGMNEVAFR